MGRSQLTVQEGGIQGEGLGFPVLQALSVGGQRREVMMVQGQLHLAFPARG